MVSTALHKEFNPGIRWNDTDGEHIQAHGGCVLFHDNKYYWYGEDKSAPTRRGKHLLCGYQADSVGIRCYESEDLYNWKNKGLVLKSSDRKDHPLFKENVMERPKVHYNTKTGKFVMWLHIDDSQYATAHAGVCVADHPTGPFHFLGSEKPNGNDSRDLTFFIDNDQRGYLIHASESNRTLYTAELDESWTKLTGKSIRNFENEHREAPVIIPYQNRYYSITSGCTCWDPNEALFGVGTSLMSKWEQKWNPCKGADSEITFYAQSTYAFSIKNKNEHFIMMFDAWNKENLARSQYIWLPIRWSKKESNICPEIEWTNSWDLNVFK